MRLLDVLEECDGEYTVNDGGQAWEIEEYVAEWQLGSEEGDRGPQVICVPGRNGSLQVVALDELGYVAEPIADLIPML